MSSWVMHQRWTNLLFAHWPLPPEAVRPLLPSSLELDTFDGKAWVGVIPFHMSDVRPRGIPPLPWVSAFHELNVRTYVRHGDRIGVWFFSLDAANPLAVRAARAAVGLPYYDARMSMSSTPDGWIHYRSDRTSPGRSLSSGLAAFEASYRPEGKVSAAEPGTLEYFLVERYALFAVRSGRLIDVKISHPPWPLQRAVARIDRNTMGDAAGLPLPGPPPQLHYGARVDVKTWPPQRA